MKDNNHIDGLVDGVEADMLDDPQILQAYALYFAFFIEQYAVERLTIEHVQPQNEPGYATRYPACPWTPALLRDFVRDYLGPTLAERTPGTDIWFGTMSAGDDAEHVRAVLEDPVARDMVQGFGLQWNTMPSVAGIVDEGYRVMVTEHKCGNYPWATGFNPDQPPNDFAYAEESWSESSTGSGLGSTPTAPGTWFSICKDTTWIRSGPGRRTLC